MGVAEPASPLWAAVKTIYDAWPADDEAVAADVAAAWRSGATVLAQGADGASQAAEASLAAWPDAAGEQFHGQARSHVSDSEALRQNVTNRAAHADYYGAQLASAKEAIVATVAQNESAFAQLDPAQRPGFATTVATNLQAMIAEKAAALRAYPADAPEVSRFAGAQGPAVLAGPEGPVPRGLNPEEMAIARQVFGDSIDLTNVQLTEEGTATKAVAGYDKINFPPGTFSRTDLSSDRYHQWLIHELTHVFQYQHGATPVQLAGAAAFELYDYGEPRGKLPNWEAERQRLQHGLTLEKEAGRQFLHFTTEQQADIIADYYYYRIANDSPPVADDPYLHYSDYVRGIEKGETLFYEPPIR
jgi:hypothetical protein